MKKLLFLGIASILFLSHCSPDPPGPAKDIGIYINELRATGGDWIEIYNSTSASVNLGGYKIYDDPLAKFTIASGSVSGKGYFVLICDGTGVGGNASFKLTSQGETIFLEDADGNLIDQVSFPALLGGSSYARFPDGDNNWKMTGEPTPNATNGEVPKPSINKVSKSPTVPALTDVVTVKATVTDAAGVSEVKLLWRKDNNAFTSTPMTLSGGVYSGAIPAAGSVGTIQYYIEAKNINNAVNVQPSTAPTNTYSYLLNTDPLPTLFINEFMAFNTSCCPDTDSGLPEFDDWIEIYNAGDVAVNIAGYNLSDSIPDPFKYTIPSTDPSKTTIPAKGYLIIWADESGLEGVLHTNFQLRTTGEQLGLYYIDGRKIDEYTFGAQTEDVSWGRTTDGGGAWKAWGVPTPKAKNQ